MNTDLAVGDAVAIAFVGQGGDQTRLLGRITDETSDERYTVSLFNGMEVSACRSCIILPLLHHEKAELYDRLVAQGFGR